MDIIISLPKKFVLFLIGLYQVSLSPDHGFWRPKNLPGFCRFHPTCSEYGRQSIENFGLIKGGFLTLARISRCHPWAKPGLDLVPESKR